MGGKGVGAASGEYFISAHADSAGQNKKHHNDVDPYCMIIFSNHPHHYAVRDLDPQQHLLSVLSQQPRAHMLSLRNLFVAAGLYGNIPMGLSTEEGDPPPPAVPVVWPKVRYDLQVAEQMLAFCVKARR